MKIQRYEHVALKIETTAGQSLAVDFGCFSPPESVRAAGRVDGVLISHRHPDHFHLEHLKVFSAPVFAPVDVTNQIKAAIPTTVFELGQRFVAAGVTVTPIAADHGPHISAPVENFGFIFEADGRRVLFTGDVAVPTPQAPGPFDLICLPVAGGRFVLDAKGALDLVRTLRHRGKVLPFHDAGPAEPGCVERFKDLAADYCEVVPLAVGQSLEV